MGQGRCGDRVDSTPRRAPASRGGATFAGTLLPSVAWKWNITLKWKSMFRVIENVSINDHHSPSLRQDCRLPGHSPLVLKRSLNDSNGPICQIAAYTPQQSYSQYIMPYGDLNPGARRRHNVRVVTVGRYRMLKDTNTHKSEISALTDFLDWLEKEKGDGSVILLLDRFKSIVAGFADSYALAADKCKATVKSVSLRVLARVLLDADSLAVSSRRWARAARARRPLRTWSRLRAPGRDPTYNTVVENASRRYPVYQYGQYSDGSRRTILFSGLEKQMAALSVSAKEEDIKELIDIFDCHFDPAKEPKGPKPRTPRNRIRATSTGETGEAGEPEGSTKLTGKR
ncbi:hypothetical protein MSG28_012714 [Choristoneura fumiferana]|uniref:Uncharacterized protein n=1 Tax=Choristoneura fumiferana TaxID=7141 RepID=A0ACC0JHV2_CHOFU|nr:hypothetical protein MSG28_012714 [Choristoneura fumiferana]